MPPNGPPARRPSLTQAPSGERPRRPAAPGGAPRPSPAPAAKLVVTAGPAAGQEFTLGAGETVVGRAADATFSIPDTSVSRRHCAFSKSAAGWVVADLGSGNGVYVNGEKIEGEFALSNGDAIVLGDTELAFSGPAGAARAPAAPAAGAPLRRAGGEAVPTRNRPVPSRARPGRAAAEPDPEAEKRKKKLLLLAGVGVGLLLLVGIGVKVKGDAAEAQRAREQAELQKQHESVRTVFQDGKNLVRAGKWKEAMAKFQEVKEAEPDHEGLADYLRLAETEIPAEENLALAEKALADNRLGDAANAIAKISPNTQQYDRLRTLKDSFSQKLPQRAVEAAAQLNSAATLARTDRQAAIAQTEQVIATLKDLLVADPENRDAKSLQEPAERQLQALKDLGKPPPPPPPADPAVKAVSLFRAGDINGAVPLLDECAGKSGKCRELAKQVREFNEGYKRVESLDLPRLEKLLYLDGKITGGGQSQLGAVVGKRAANFYYKQATNAKSAGKWTAVVEFADKALKADGNHQAARNLRDEARSKASDIYLQCYSIKDTDPDTASTCFKDFMRMVGPSHDKYAAAKNWVEKLSR